MKKLFTDLFKAMDAAKLIGAKKEKKVEEKKAASDDETVATPAREVETETEASEQGTPGFNKEASEKNSEQRVEEDVELTEW
jgi:hypothetical protein